MQCHEHISEQLCRCQAEETPHEWQPNVCFDSPSEFNSQPEHLHQGNIPFQRQHSQESDSGMRTTRHNNYMTASFVPYPNEHNPQEEMLPVLKDEDETLRNLEGVSARYLTLSPCYNGSWSGMANEIPWSAEHLRGDGHGPPPRPIYYCGSSGHGQVTPSISAEETTEYTDGREPVTSESSYGHHLGESAPTVQGSRFSYNCTHPKSEARTSTGNPSQSPLPPASSVDDPKRVWSNGHNHLTLASSESILEDMGENGQLGEMQNFSGTPSDRCTLICPVQGCEATFTGRYAKGNLGRHQKYKHRNAKGDEEAPQCVECEKRFQRGDALVKHYRSAHDGRHATPHKRRKIVLGQHSNTRL